MLTTNIFIPYCFWVVSFNTIELIIQIQNYKLNYLSFVCSFVLFLSYVLSFDLLNIISFEHLSAKVDGFQGNEWNDGLIVCEIFGYLMEGDCSQWRNRKHFKYQKESSRIWPEIHINVDRKFQTVFNRVFIAFWIMWPCISQFMQQSNSFKINISVILFFVGFVPNVNSALLFYEYPVFSMKTVLDHRFRNIAGSLYFKYRWYIIKRFTFVKL